MIRWFCLFGALSAFAAERWDLQYFYDEDKSSLVLIDIAFSSPQRGMALGSIEKGRSSEPVLLTTANGGTQWSQVKLEDHGTSLFLLDDANAWITTRSAIWFSDEGGRSWRRLAKTKDIRRVCFTSPTRGWAIGTGKKILATQDGGKTWVSLPAATALETSPDRTAFYAIDFATPKSGMIIGKAHSRRRPPLLPLWLDPEPESRPEWPSLSIFLETRDGGNTWVTSKSSLFGTITGIDLEASGGGLALIRFSDFFDFPSELFRIDLTTGKSTRTLRRKDFAATDIAIATKGFALAAGYQPSGRLAQSPMPGKLRILKSANLVDWSDMEVDYRALARSVAISAVDEKHAWAATDTGMILRLVQD